MTKGFNECLVRIWYTAKQTNYHNKHRTNGTKQSVITRGRTANNFTNYYNISTRDDDKLKSETTDNGALSYLTRQPALKTFLGMTTPQHSNMNKKKFINERIQLWIHSRHSWCHLTLNLIAYHERDKETDEFSMDLLTKHLIIQTFYIYLYQRFDLITLDDSLK